MIYPKTFWEKIKWLIAFSILPLIQSCASCPKEEGIILYKGKLDPKYNIEQYIVVVRYGGYKQNKYKITQEISFKDYTKVKVGDVVKIDCGTYIIFK